MDNIISAQERLDAFHENGFRYGNDPHYWDYAQCIAVLLEQSLEHVEGLVGKEFAARALRELVEPIASVNHPNAETWRDVMEDVLSAGTELPIGERMHDALLYGFYGIVPSKILAPQRSQWIDDLVNEVTGFAARSDVGSLGDNNAILLIARLAVSRHAIDLGRGEVDIHSLSIFGSVSEGRLRNLLAGSEAQLERGPGGGVVAMSALAWLQKRKDFLASIWREDETNESEVAEATILVDQMIFVPVARDGSMFNPDLERGGQYQIGAKGIEQTFDTFEAALDALNEMPVPRWRRPNEQGNWGIVSGVAWQRIARN